MSRVSRAGDPTTARVSTAISDWRSSLARRAELQLGRRQELPLPGGRTDRRSQAGRAVETPRHEEAAGLHPAAARPRRPTEPPCASNPRSPSPQEWYPSPPRRCTARANLQAKARRPSRRSLRARFSRLPSPPPRCLRRVKPHPRRRGCSSPPIVPRSGPLHTGATDHRVRKRASSISRSASRCRASAEPGCRHRFRADGRTEAPLATPAPESPFERAVLLSQCADALLVCLEQVRQRLDRRQRHAVRIHRVVAAVVVAQAERGPKVLRHGTEVSDPSGLVSIRHVESGRR